MEGGEDDLHCKIFDMHVKKVDVSLKTVNDTVLVWHSSRPDPSESACSQTGTRKIIRNIRVSTSNRREDNELSSFFIQGGVAFEKR